MIFVREIVGLCESFSFSGEKKIPYICRVTLNRKLTDILMTHAATNFIIVKMKLL